jgi:hypothetical protein
VPTVAGSKQFGPDSKMLFSAAGTPAQVRATNSDSQGLGQRRVAILDASIFLFQYHHGYNSSSAQHTRLTSPIDGHDTSIQHSFLTFVINLLQDRSSTRSPWGAIDHIIVVFDGGVARQASSEEPKKTDYRKSLLTTYKV